MTKLPKPKSFSLKCSLAEGDTSDGHHHNFYKHVMAKTRDSTTSIGTLPERADACGEVRYLVPGALPPTESGVADSRPSTGYSEQVLPLQIEAGTPVVTRPNLKNRHKAVSAIATATSANVCANDHGQLQRRAVAAVRGERTDGQLAASVRDFYPECDELTGLPVRSSYFKSLQQAVDQANFQKKFIAVFFVGLDHFKIINTIFGHTVGDLVLQQIAQRLARHFADGVLLARLGGDEFALALQDVPDIENAMRSAELVLEVIKEPLFVEHQEIRMTASIGFTIGPDQPLRDDALGMMHRAGIAMASVKSSGCDRVAAYSTELAASHKGHAISRYVVFQRLARLTPREKEVLQLLIEGRANKMIAFLLGNSNRTIENHRARIMRKMNAKSLPELVRMVIGP